MLADRVPYLRLRLVTILISTVDFGWTLRQLSFRRYSRLADSRLSFLKHSMVRGLRVAQEGLLHCVWSQEFVVHWDWRFYFAVLLSTFSRASSHPVCKVKRTSQTRNRCLVLTLPQGYSSVESRGRGSLQLVSSDRHPLIHKVVTWF